jgi:hypothetical protein
MYGDFIETAFPHEGILNTDWIFDTTTGYLPRAHV